MKIKPPQSMVDKGGFGYEAVYMPPYYFLLFCCFMYSSKAAVMDGACGIGACISRRRPASVTAFAVAGPNDAMIIFFC